MWRTYLPWLLRLLGPVLLVLFLINSDLSRIGTLLMQAAPVPILISLVLMPPFIFIKGWRWRYLLRELRLDVPLRTAVGLYVVAIFWGAVTPGQSGDFAKAWYVRERGQPLAPALLSTMIDRLCDLIVMAAIATIGIMALGQLLPDPALRTLLIVLMGVGLVIVTILLGMRTPRQWLLTVLLPRIAPQRLQASLERWNTQLSSLTLHPRLVLVLALTSLASAAFTFYRLWLLFIALDVTIPLHIVVGISALVAVLQVLPIAVAGMGVRDAVLIAVITSPAYGYSLEQALAVSALFLLLTLQHILIGFIVSFWYPLGKQMQAEVENAG
jgi:uncharacterized protein (TIRG00374 family)